MAAADQTSSKTMRSLAIEKYSKPEGYQIMQLPAPKIEKPDQVLVKVHAASINPIDVKVASGIAKLFWSSPFPYKLGYDLSGTVVEVGSDAASSRPDLVPGAEVYARVPEQCRGTVSEYALSTLSATALKPPSLSHADAASIPLASLTTLQVLDRAERALPGGLRGKTVFVPGGLSGTGATALQLAKRVFGAGHTITTVSTSKVAKVPELLGTDVVDQIVDYTQADSATAIPNGSVDFLYDTMNQGLASLHLMKRGGVIVSISGIPFGDEMKVRAPDMPIMLVWLFNVLGAVARYRARRYGVTFLKVFVQPSATDLDRLSGWIERGELRPVVGRVAKLDDLEDVRAGCQQVYDGKGGVGKFVIEVAA